jgi:nucleotide-binding universal stress UspA family protein
MSFKKILFPTDFSPNAERALAHAVRLAGIDHGEIIVQHVVGDYFGKHPHWATLFDIHELQKYIDGYALGLFTRVVPNDDAGDVRMRTVISKGKPAEEIANLAREEFVDIVVMGSAKGVITNKVLRMTDRPVLAVSARQPSPDETGLHKLEKILVATDFSEHSERIVQRAFELKRAFGCAIYMLYVIDAVHGIEWAVRQGHFVNGKEKMREWAHNKLINLTPDEFINDPAVIRLVEDGSAGDMIAAVAFDIDADLTIVGTHEYGAMHQRLLGTTTDTLLSKTSTPVLAVKL